mgnify:CR=1 FL=1
MAIRDELIEELMKGYEKPEDLIDENWPLKDLKKRLLEKALQGELTDHLGYPKWSVAGKKGYWLSYASSETIASLKDLSLVYLPWDRCTLT